MGQRRFGPVFGAGTAIVEKESQKTIAPGALGTTAYTGHMQKGPIGKLFLALNKTQFLFKGGTLISEGQLPDAALDFYEQSEGAGALWFNRVTDGNEKTSLLSLKNRRSARFETVQIDAGNAGKWAGQKRTIIDEYLAVTTTTVSLSNVPAGLKKDELVGGKVTFNAVSAKSFEIISNTAAGVLTVPSDVDLLAELGASVDTLISVKLTNNGNAIGILIKDGLDKPSEQWGMEVFFTENGITRSVKNFTDLSSDPASDDFFEKVINDDPDTDFTVKIVNQHTGSITADIRPANVFGISLTLTDTVLTAKIHDEFSSAVSGATAKADPLTLGASIIVDEVTLTISTAGARATESLTFSGNAANDETVTINTKVITWKTVVGDPTSEVEVGGDAETSIDNLVTFIDVSTDVLLKDIVFAEKQTAAIMDLFANTAGTAGNAITTTQAMGSATWGDATLSGGVDQIWDYVSKNMPFLTGLTVTSGVAFNAPNDFGAGFTIIDTTEDSTKVWAVADTLKINVCPLEVNALADGVVIPNVLKPRVRFAIDSNTANQITTKVGSQMLIDATVGDEFRVEAIQELSGGFDGLAEVVDQNFIAAYDVATSALRGLRGRNLGLVKLGTPGVTAVAIEKAGVTFGESQNWQYRYEIPSNINDEQAANEFVDDTLGRNDFAVVSWPSFAFETARIGKGLKLVTQTGAIHGEEAKIANNFLGFHKAAAGSDAILSNIRKLPAGFEDKVIDEEFTNPRGLNIIKRDGGNFILWGDRTVGIDPAFKFKHHREQLSHYENIFIENFNFIIFTINDQESDNLARASFIQFFTPELAKRALRGDKLIGDAMILKIDDENNTDGTRALGDKNAELALRLADTTERFIITISKQGVTEG